MKVSCKNVIRIIAVILEIICFLPTMTVSCSGESVGISVLDVMTGIGNEEMTYVEPQWICLIAFLLPIGLFFGWIKMNKEKEREWFTGMLVDTGADIIFWICYKHKFVEKAQSLYCTAEVKGLYHLNLILLMITFVLFACMLFGIITAEQSFLEVISFSHLKSGQDIRENFSQMQFGSGISKETISEEPEKEESAQVEQYDGFCIKCGAKMRANSRFCAACGAERK